MQHASGPDSATESSREHPRRSQLATARTARAVLFAGGLVALLVALIFPWTTWCNWPAARRAQCANNLKQIALVLHAYHAAYGALPPAYIADEKGRPLHSWRVLILPFLEQQSLYDQYDFREPWDGPNNVKLLGNKPFMFECPSKHATGPGVSKFTSYVAISGPGMMFPGAETIRLDQVTDRPAETLMVVEVLNVQIPWTKPDDLDVQKMGSRVNDRKYPSISSNHPGGANAALGDAACRFLPDSTPAMLLKSLVTIARGEALTPSW